MAEIFRSTVCCLEQERINEKFCMCVGEPRTMCVVAGVNCFLFFFAESITGPTIKVMWWKSCDNHSGHGLTILWVSEAAQVWCQLLLHFLLTLEDHMLILDSVTNHVGMLSYFPTVPAVPDSCNVTSLSYNQSSGRLLFIDITWDSMPVSHITHSWSTYMQVLRTVSFMLYRQLELRMETAIEKKVPCIELSNFFSSQADKQWSKPSWEK